ncbi:hypothetical protein JOQ06_005417, partial [Pogonophryne albipinna]
MSSYKHKSGATKRKEKDKKEDQGKAKLSKLDGYFFRPTPPPAGPEVVATASRVSSPSPSPPTTLVGVSQIYSDDDNRDDSAAASCSSRGEPGLTLDQPHPSPSGSLPAAPQGVQARIAEKEPLAHYVHCAAHNLNLALNDSVKNVPGVKQFYDTLLQAKDADILKASTLLQNAISVLVEYRGQFDEVKSATLALATKWGSQTQFETTRARKVKRHFDELSEDSRLTDAESNFR